MKKISISIAMMAFFTLAIAFTSCKSKVSDADVKTAVETALKADPMAVNTMVSVEKGVAGGVSKTQPNHYAKRRDKSTGG